MLYTFPSQAVRARTEQVAAECLRCLFAPWSGELTLALDREDSTRPRRRFRWDPFRPCRRQEGGMPGAQLPALAEGERAAWPVRPRTPRKRADGPITARAPSAPAPRLGPCGHAPAECLRCLFAAGAPAERFAAQCLGCHFAPRAARFARALREDSARPRGLHPGQFAPWSGG